MKFVQTIFFVVFSINLHAQIDCSDYKTGKFVAKSEEFGDSYIKRTKKYQIETGIDYRSKAKYKIKDKIVWLDDCTYQLHPGKNKGSTVVDNSILTFKIIEAFDNYYMVHVSGLQDFEVEVRVDVVE